MANGASKEQFEAAHTSHAGSNGVLLNVLVLQSDDCLPFFNQEEISLLDLLLQPDIAAQLVGCASFCLVLLPVLETQ